ncbi:MAG: CPBP family intramembrane metalloprotease [Clostridia bacterium]|nr:CPBP family intramembrane metalloprotease [Clostridia bacterium]
MKEHIRKYGIIYFMALFLFLITARVIIYLRFDSAIEDVEARLIVSHIFRFFIWALPPFLYLVFIDKVNPFTYLKLSTSLKKGVLFSLLLVPLGALWQLAEMRFRGDTIGSISFLSAITLIVIPMFEEILARGFVLNKLSDIMPFKYALPFSALFFWMCHIPGWILISPDVIRFHLLTYSFSVFLVVGILGGMLMKKSNSLYPSIMLHMINNFISSI